MIAGITRVRNEALIIHDTLKHWLNRLDHVFLYDECSEDDTAEIAEGCPRTTVIRGKRWNPNQASAETQHRKELTQAADYAGFDWVFCFDADERLHGDLPANLEHQDAFSFRLFDGYMTYVNKEPYSGGVLRDLPRMWGPEYRDIVMLYRPRVASWPGPGMRAPAIRGSVGRADGVIKHYGKCLSVEHWEETCDFYSRYFPRFADKWEARKGKAIHVKSDFGAALHAWPDVIKYGYPLK